MRPLSDFFSRARPQAIQTGFGRDEFPAEFLEPCGMGEIAGAQHRNPLSARPEGQMLQVALAAGGQGVFRVHVQVGVEHGAYYNGVAQAQEPAPPAYNLQSLNTFSLDGGVRMAGFESTTKRAPRHLYALVWAVS